MKEIIKKVAEELNIPEEVVETAYKYFFKYIKTSIESLPLKEDLSKEDFNKLRCNFNIPSLGKLYVTYDRYLNMKKRFNYINKFLENERKEN